MSRPTLTPAPIQSGMENWDAEIEDNFANVADHLQSAPLPIYEHTGDESTVAGVWPPGQYDRCLIWVNHSVDGWLLCVSDGTNWMRVLTAAL